MKMGWVLAFAGLMPFLASAAETPKLFTFSPQFKAAVDTAMKQQTPQTRTDALINAMHGGTNEEVFSILPGLFPKPIISAATEAGVCTDEIHASLDTVNKFLATPEGEQQAFISRNSNKIRTDTDDLIRCICRYYRDGKLYFPGTQPGLKSETLNE